MAEPRERVLLDAAQGPLHPAARETLLAALDVGWADPRRLYAEGRQARMLLDQAREEIATGLGVRPEELSFTPGGPAALRAGLDGLRYAGRSRGARVVASAVEHSAVLADGRAVAAAGADPHLFDEVGVDGYGRVDLDGWSRAVAVPGTTAAVVQSANGEVGSRQPVEAAREACRAHGIPLLVDAQASLGRDPVPGDYDVLAGQAGSWGGPSTVGVLVVPARTRWWRSGLAPDVEGGRLDIVPDIPLALAAAEAWRQTAATRDADAAEAHRLVDRIRQAAATVPDTEVVGHPEERLPHVVTFSALFVDGEVLLGHFDRRGFAVASGSACTASTVEPSHVLAAMGALTHGNVRITLPLRAVEPRREVYVDSFCGVLADVVDLARADLGSDRP